MNTFKNEIILLLKQVNPLMYISSESKEYINNVTILLITKLTKNIVNNNLIDSFRSLLSENLFRHGNDICVISDKNYIFVIDYKKVGKIAKIYNENLSEKDVLLLRCFIEYLLCQIIEVAGDLTRDNKKKIITNKFIIDAINKDVDLKYLFENLGISLTTINKKSNVSRKSNTRKRKKKN